MNQPKNSARLVWVDLEMTGLDVKSNHILEIACTITDHQLEELGRLPSIVIHQPETILQDMDEWCTLHHTQSGLLERVRTSQVSITQAEQQVLAFIKQYCHPQQSPLCGNSIWVDKLFLLMHMPTITDYLHYRIVDVSSVKLLVHDWYGYTPEKPAFTKKKTHRAFDDIAESIDELKFYRKNFFK